MFTATCFGEFKFHINVFYINNNNSFVRNEGYTNPRGKFTKTFGTFGKTEHYTSKKYYKKKDLVLYNLFQVIGITNNVIEWSIVIKTPRW